MPFAIFSREIQTNPQFWQASGFLRYLLMRHGPFLLQMTSTLPESSPPLSASLFSLKAFLIFLPFLATSRDKGV